MRDLYLILPARSSCIENRHAGNDVSGFMNYVPWEIIDIYCILYTTFVVENSYAIVDIPASIDRTSR